MLDKTLVPMIILSLNHQNHKLWLNEAMFAVHWLDTIAKSRTF